MSERKGTGPQTKQRFWLSFDNAFQTSPVVWPSVRRDVVNTSWPPQSGRVIRYHVYKWWARLNDSFFLSMQSNHACSSHTNQYLKFDNTYLCWPPCVSTVSLMEICRRHFVHMQSIFTWTLTNAYHTLWLPKSVQINLVKNITTVRKGKEPKCEHAKVSNVFYHTEVLPERRRKQAKQQHGKEGRGYSTISSVHLSRVIMVMPYEGCSQKNDQIQV